MDHVKNLEVDLQEAACVGDAEAVEELLNKGINVNAKHHLNGWTALHWAVKRNHIDVVKLLLDHGADTSLTTNKGETIISMCSKPEIRHLLDKDAEGPCEVKETTLPITPYYLKHPQIPVSKLSSKKTVGTGDVATVTNTCSTNTNSHHHSTTEQNDELVLKVRIANTGDPDFIEVELPRADLTYARLLRVCCEELGISATQVLRVRKLPDTLVRKDKDVQRFQNFQELEIVTTVAPGKSKVTPGANGLVSPNTNRYQSISLYKNQTILY